MQSYQLEFIEFAIKKEVLRFGEFTLKSGRVSPYFFNSSLFSEGKSLRMLGEFYAKTLAESQLEFNTIYGPAYKGIPLASSLAIALERLYEVSVPYCFNRKEPKDHGEGGATFGATLTGNVLIVDDVITSGTSVRESVDIIERADAQVAGVIVALDRQEKGDENISAIQEIKNKYKIPVISIISLNLLIEYLDKEAGLGQHLQDIQQYQKHYGAES